jgi:hypothetical protein
VELDVFLDVQERVEELKERTETKRAVDCMLVLVREICTYINGHTSNGILGRSCVCNWLYVALC